MDWGVEKLIMDAENEILAEHPAGEIQLTVADARMGLGQKMPASNHSM